MLSKQTHDFTYYSDVPEDAGKDLLMETLRRCLSQSSILGILNSPDCNFFFTLEFLFLLEKQSQLGGPTSAIVSLLVPHPRQRFMILLLTSHLNAFGACFNFHAFLHALTCCP